jgi:ATP-dependent Lon protease
MREAVEHMGVFGVTKGKHQTFGVMSEEETSNGQSQQNADQGEQQPPQGEQQSGQMPGGLQLASEILPEELTIIPIKDRPLFPGITVPLTFSGEKALKSVQNAYEQNNATMGVVLSKDSEVEDPFSAELYEVGTALKIFKIAPVDSNTVQVLVQGIRRFEHTQTEQTDPILRWKVQYHYDPDEKPDEHLKAYMMSITSEVKELLNYNPLSQEQLKMILSQMDYQKPGLMMDVIAYMLSADREKLQHLLAQYDFYDRAQYLLILLREEIELTKVKQRINEQIQEKVNQQQKEYFLREQLKAIKRELGIEKDEKQAEIDKLEEKFNQLELPQKVRQQVNEEMEKFRMLEPTSPEFNVSRNYLESLASLPWGIFSQDVHDIQKARQVLDEDHYGLEDVKNNVLEFLSSVMKSGKLSGSIICLVGPPGVGKTSIGRSIARALNREFTRFSLGGMRDEAEIKGHRRTYIGAMPGKLIQSIQRCGTQNPVVMLDEIDKLGISFQGDPASALLEVLDPEQNEEFVDHYLDVPFDLSNVLFVTTANQLDTIQQPLLDRMEVIRLSGYVTEEKIEIAQRHLIPKQVKEQGFSTDEVGFEREAVRTMIEQYAREAGVRSLEKYVRKALRQIALQEAEGKEKISTITADKLEPLLGKAVYNTEELYDEGMPGVALGLAYTQMGGVSLYIEATSFRTNQAGFQQTGQLGKVMEESSKIAYSYVRSLLGSQNGKAEFFNQNEISLHVPEGATPKDGPSAGITMALALYSLATGKPVREKLAMTGELTLTGKILPIGGVREKLIAARRVGVTDVILPIANQKDCEELPEYICRNINVHYANRFEDVLQWAFEKEPVASQAQAEA